MSHLQTTVIQYIGRSAQGGDIYVRFIIKHGIHEKSFSVPSFFSFILSQPTYLLIFLLLPYLSEELIQFL